MEVEKHPTFVTGWSGTLEELAQTIARMRYDKIAEFAGHLQSEVKRQRDADKASGKRQLAMMLDRAVYDFALLRTTFDEIWKLCRKHM